MSKNNTKSRVYPYVLKSLHDDIMRDNKNSTLTTKAMRVKLRAKFNDTHTKNQTWSCANAREYDTMRSMFDAQYATRIANARKRNAKKNDASSNDATTETRENA